MFGHITTEAVQQLGLDLHLICNQNRNHSIDLMTLVKVKREKLWPVIHYKFTDKTLLDLLDEDYTPEYSEEDLITDFRILTAGRGDGGVSVHVPEPRPGPGGSGGSEGSGGSGGTPFALKMKSVDTEDLKSNCIRRKVKKKTMDLLKVKQGEEKLAFVYKKVYNVSAVRFTDRAGRAGRVVETLRKLFNLRRMENMKKERSFVLPVNSTFAYGLMEIRIDGDGKLVPFQIKKMKKYIRGRWGIHCDGQGQESAAGQ